MHQQIHQSTPVTDFQRLHEGVRRRHLNNSSGDANSSKDASPEPPSRMEPIENKEGIAAWLFIPLAPKDASPEADQERPPGSREAAMGN